MEEQTDKSVSESVLQETTELVQEEIRRRADKERISTPVLSYLDNFRFNLLLEENELIGANARRLMKHHSDWEMRLREVIINMRVKGSLSAEGVEDELELHSELYLSKTPRQFFQDVDRAIEHTGYTTEHLDRLITGFRLLADGEKERISTEVFLPIYIYLRALGYNGLDLMSTPS